jgi:hypothetical protein
VSWQRVLSRRDLIRVTRSVGIGCAFLGMSPTACKLETAEDDFLAFGLKTRPLFCGLLRSYSQLAKPLAKTVIDRAYELCWRLLSGISQSQPMLYSDLGLAFTILELGPLFSSKLARFSDLANSDQVAFLKEWQSLSGFQADITYGVRPLFMFAIYDQPELKKLLGIDPPMVARSRIGKLGL